jgi:hydrogenase maturation factor HypF (carbamoyltransferase family)
MLLIHQCHARHEEAGQYHQHISSKNHPSLALLVQRKDDLAKANNPLHYELHHNRHCHNPLKNYFCIYHTDNKILHHQALP